MNTYSASDFFMVRTPLLPIEDYMRMDGSASTDALKKDLWDIFQTPMLKETVSVASVDLSEAVKRTNLLEASKSSEQVASSLLKYYIRATTRPTPFGLFSGISIGRFGEESKISLAPHSNHRKRARADMEWIYKIIKLLEADSEIRKHLRVRFNDFTYHSGNRLEKTSQTFLQKDEEQNAQNISTSIRFTKPVQFLQKHAKDFQSISDLVSGISNENPSVPPQKIEGFVSQLLENEYLISELRPPLINTDALDYLIHTLNRMQYSEQATHYATELKTVRKNIESYNATSIGAGQIAYQNVVQSMSALFKSKNYLQVDTKLQTSSNCLDKELKSELEDFVSAMVRMTPKDELSDEMLHYRDLFAEKYGYGAEVPVLELLDVDHGLGAPAGYSSDVVRRPVPKRARSSKSVRLDTMLERKIMFAMHQNQNTIELTEEDIDYVAGNNFSFKTEDPMDAPQSFELYLLAHPGKGDNNVHCFTLAPAICSRGVGHSFGRFNDILSQEELGLLNQEIQHQQELLSDYVIAEIAELPARGRTSNVTINNSNHDYQIALTANPCEGKKVLSIQDLYVGIDRKNQQFYIRSKSLNKKVLVVMTSMLNPTYGSTALKFLREISSTRHTDIIHCISKLAMNKYDYSPRITYKKVIIKPETWMISNDILGLSETNQETFLKCFDLYRKQWNIPRYVLMTEFDNRLLLDLENPMHLTELYHSVKKPQARIALVEPSCDFKDYAATDENGNHYVTELVVPFVLNSSDKNTTTEENSKNFFQKNKNAIENCMNIPRDEFAVLPGKFNWLFYKLYGCSKRQDELIALLHAELEENVRSGLIQQYFFIRYADSEPHLRVRIQATQNQLPTIFLKMSLYFEQLRLNGIISRVVIDTYQRELERYGGPLLIEDAERYFCQESRMIMNMISRQRYSLLDTEFEYITASFAIAALGAFGLSPEQQEEFLSTKANPSAYRKEFQKNRKMLMYAVDADNDWKQIRSHIKNPEIYNLLNQLAESMNQYAEHVLELNQKGLTTCSVENILSSVLHMFCNRLMGNTSWEQKVYALTRHAMHALLESKKHRIKNSHQ